MITIVRWCEVNEDIVRWGNVVGSFCGQEGRWRFASEADAKAFAEYAKSEGAPAIDDQSLLAANIPIPIERL